MSKSNPAFRSRLAEHGELAGPDGECQWRLALHFRERHGQAQNEPNVNPSPQSDHDGGARLLAQTFHAALLEQLVLQPRTEQHDMQRRRVGKAAPDLHDLLATPDDLRAGLLNAWKSGTYGLKDDVTMPSRSHVVRTISTLDDRGLQKAASLRAHDPRGSSGSSSLPMRR